MKRMASDRLPPRRMEVAHLRTENDANMVDIFSSSTHLMGQSPPCLARLLCRTNLGHSKKNLEGLTRTRVRGWGGKTGIPPENQNFGALQDPFTIILNKLCQLKSLMLPKIEKYFRFRYYTPHLLPYLGNLARNEDTTRNRSWKTGRGGIAKSIS